MSALCVHVCIAPRYALRPLPSHPSDWRPGVVALAAGTCFLYCWLKLSRASWRGAAAFPATSGGTRESASLVHRLDLPRPGQQQLQSLCKPSLRMATLEVPSQPHLSEAFVSHAEWTWHRGKHLCTHLSSQAYCFGNTQRLLSPSSHHYPTTKKRWTHHLPVSQHTPHTATHGSMARTRASAGASNGDEQQPTQAAQQQQSRPDSGSSGG